MARMLEAGGDYFLDLHAACWVDLGHEHVIRLCNQGGKKERVKLDVFLKGKEMDDPILSVYLDEPCIEIKLNSTVYIRK